MIAQILAGVSILVAVLTHLKLPNSFWKASFISSVVIVLLTLLSMFVFETHFFGIQSNHLQDYKLTAISFIVGGIAAFYGFLISLLVGCLFRVVKTSDYG